jgi:hypothetical protein
MATEDETETDRDTIRMDVDVVDEFDVDSNGRIYIGQNRSGQTLKCALRAVGGNSAED